MVTGDGRAPDQPRAVRNIFLGLNDGLVEILGAVSGFFGAFGEPDCTVLIAGTYHACGRRALDGRGRASSVTSSESEVQATEDAPATLPGGEVVDDGQGPIASALVVGLGYFAGALVTVLPGQSCDHSVLSVTCAVSEGLAPDTLMV